MTDSLPTLGFIHSMVDSVAALMAEKALEYGDYRGGGAIGFKDQQGRPWVVTFRVNETLLDKNPEKDRHFNQYAGMKVSTALISEKDSQNLHEELLPMQAVDEGAVVHWSIEQDAWIAIGYSGLTAENDKQIATEVLNQLFMTN